MRMVSFFFSHYTVQFIFTLEVKAKKLCIASLSKSTYKVNTMTDLKIFKVQIHIKNFVIVTRVNVMH